MKTIPNPTFEVEFADIPKPITAARLLQVCLSRPPAQGFDYATMRARNKVEDVLDKATDGGTIELEDADHATACACVRDMRWGIKHRDLVKFADLFGC